MCPWQIRRFTVLFSLKKYLLCGMDSCIRPIILLLQAQLLIIEYNSWKVSLCLKTGARIHYIAHVEQVFLLILHLWMIIIYSSSTTFLCYSLWLSLIFNWCIMPLLINKMLHWMVTCWGILLVLFYKNTTSCFYSTMLIQIVIFVHDLIL